MQERQKYTSGSNQGQGRSQVLWMLVAGLVAIVLMYFSINSEDRTLSIALLTMSLIVLAAYVFYYIAIIKKWLEVSRRFDEAINMLSDAIKRAEARLR